MVIETGLELPEAAPLHPTNSHPLFAVAVTVTTSFGEKGPVLLAETLPPLPGLAIKVNEYFTTGAVVVLVGVFVLVIVGEGGVILRGVGVNVGVGVGG